MFHRRLALLASVIVLGMVAPVLQLARWTLAHPEEHRLAAESRLVNWRWLPASRGRIEDRRERVLAQDRPSFEIAADYQVITGQWAYARAWSRAAREHRERWAALPRSQRRTLAEQYEHIYRDQLDRMWGDFAALGGISREELEARKEEVKARVQRLVSHTRAVRMAEQEERAIASGTPPRLKPSDINAPVAEQTQAHVLLRNVPDRVAFEFLRRVQDVDEDVSALTGIARMPGVSVVDSRTREYPLDAMTATVDRSTFPSPLAEIAVQHVRVEGVATHVLGRMRSRVWAEDNAGLSTRLPDGAPNGRYYLPGDSIGAVGMERAAEDDLRGVRGVQVRHLDTGEIAQTPPRDGLDVRLTIDVGLQAAIQALLAPEVGLTVVQPWHSSRHSEDEQPRGVPTIGEALASAAVVIEIDSGDILALVTSPSYSRQTLREQPGAIYDDKVFLPAVNRAISMPYPPGSIVKPLVLCGAVTSGVYRPAEHLACTGHFYPNQPGILQCWTQKQFKTNHTIMLGRDLDGSDAIMGSCNVFFYEMGRRLGLGGISGWFSRFGVGRDAVLWDLGGDAHRRADRAEHNKDTDPLAQYPGALPGSAEKSPADAPLLGIGQGPIAWTPLHAADAYATIARGGVRIVPRLRTDTPAQRLDLQLDPRGVEQALAGLRRAVEDDAGTAHHITIDTPAGRQREPIFNVLTLPGITVWAKSGTADASALLADLDGDGRPEVVRDGDHAWCVLLVGDAISGAEPRPRYAVAVVVDYGGSGGRVAGPIANQVVWTLVRMGYLKPLGQGE